jgi:hypothetical protein
VSPGPAVALLGAAVAAALLSVHTASLVAITLLLATVCVRVPGRGGWISLAGIAFSAATIFVLTPFVETIGSHPLWAGPVIPVVGQLDVTSEELWSGLHDCRPSASRSPPMRF